MARLLTVAIAAALMVPADALVAQRLTAFTRSPSVRRTSNAVMSETPPDEAAADTPPAEPVVAPAPVKNKQYDVSKLTGARNEDGSLQGGGAGFNQFDPILFLSGLISRRFGIVGGLTVVALVASTEGFEIFKSLSDTLI